MKVFILLSAVAVAIATPQCGENSHYNSCGTACPLTCDNYDNPPKFCVLMCNPGCHCDEGFVKNAEEECVRPEQCPSETATFSFKCGENEHFESCGTACPLTCDNYDNPPLICVLRCDIGCHCDEGYVRNSEGQCVKPQECPRNLQQVCGENQRYLECGTACPLTCDNYDNPPKICPAMCVMGCHCEKGYVKTKDGRCVRPENCPSSARPLEKNCVDKADRGMCFGYFPSWYHDVNTKKCHEFVYGGCQGNGNNYATEEECLEHCGAASAPSACLEDKKVGVCDAAFRRFYFNKQTGQCEEFIYGGCNGNSNNFHSQEDCEAVCIE